MLTIDSDDSLKDNASNNEIFQIENSSEVHTLAKMV